MHSPNIALVTNGIKLTNLKMPVDITAAINSHGTLAEAAKAWSSNYTDMVRAWSKAILANQNPLDDPNVQRQAIAHLLNVQGLEHTVRSISEELTVEAITANVDEILAAYKTTADAAGETLTDAHTHLGDVSLDETSTIFRLGPLAVRKHLDATEAVKTMRVIDKGWGALAQLTGFAPASTQFIDRLADTDLHTWEQHRARRDVWELIRAGATINLAITREEVDRRIQRHQDDLAARQRTEDSALNHQFKIALGTGATTS